MRESGTVRHGRKCSAGSEPVPRRTQASSIEHFQHPKVQATVQSSRNLQCAAPSGMSSLPLSRRPDISSHRQDGKHGTRGSPRAIWKRQRLHPDGLPDFTWVSSSAGGTGISSAPGSMRTLAFDLILGRSEDGIQPANHPAFAGARQIEVTFAVTFEKCRDTVVILSPKAKQYIVVAIERSALKNLWIDRPRNPIERPPNNSRRPYVALTSVARVPMSGAARSDLVLVAPSMGAAMSASCASFPARSATMRLTSESGQKQTLPKPSHDVRFASDCGHCERPITVRFVPIPAVDSSAID